MIVFFYGIIDLTYIGQYYRPFTTLYASADLNHIAAQRFWAAILRITLYFLVGLVLYAKAENVIKALSFGLVDKSELNDPPAS